MIEKIKIYISGPMTGLPNNNAEAFDEAERVLKEAGLYDPVNPAELDRQMKKELGGLNNPGDVYQFFRRDFRALLDCQAIYMLPGWEKSYGARVELLVARCMNLLTYHADDAVPPENTPAFEMFHAGDSVPEWNIAETGAIYNHKQINKHKSQNRSVLQEADYLINADRMKDYGHPKEDFARVSGMLSALGYRKINSKTGQPEELQPHDFPIIMICCKLSRLANGISDNYYHRDSVVDIGGYAGTLEKIYQPKKNQAS